MDNMTDQIGEWIGVLEYKLESETHRVWTHDGFLLTEYYPSWAADSNLQIDKLGII